MSKISSQISVIQHFPLKKMPTAGDWVDHPGLNAMSVNDRHNSFEDDSSQVPITFYDHHTSSPI
jgi:hypothetical protein